MPVQDAEGMTFNDFIMLTLCKSSCPQSITWLDWSVTEFSRNCLFLPNLEMLTEEPCKEDQVGCDDKFARLTATRERREEVRMRRARPIPLCSFTWRSATFPSHPLPLECLMIPSKIALRSHVGSEERRDVSLVRCRRCRATLICGASDRGAGRLPEISLRRLTAKPPKFIYALIASHSPLSLSHSHACNAVESRFRFIASLSLNCTSALLHRLIPRRRDFARRRRGR